MTIITLLLAIVVAAVAFLERIAFAIIIALMGHWLWRATTPVRVRLWAGFLILRGQCRLWVEVARRWWAMRALRSQLAGGATP